MPEEHLNRAPKWDEGGHVHNWKRHVPQGVQEMWGGFSKLQRMALYDWAQGLAEAEEWD